MKERGRRKKVIAKDTSLVLITMVMVIMMIARSTSLVGIPLC